ncbi:MAG TPA: hypothetical protein VGC76_02185 [Pyrinomonadaceae bacterium]|jgi:hypothetical protein
MIENLPGYISITFILTTFLTIGFLFYAIRQTAFDTTAAKVVIFLINFWIFFQGIFALGGFYQNTQSAPPRLPVFGVLPAILLIVALFVFARKSFIEALPLKILTLLSIIRIPVEIILHWLYQNKAIPQIMTYEGWNFDILSGISAPIIFWLAFRGRNTNRRLLIVWNIAALILLVNIVSIAIISLDSPFNRVAPDQQNRAVLYFPFIWLPAIIVPIVLFSHLASLWKLFKSDS